MTLQVSFEFFPPRTPEMEETLWRAIKRLEPLSPRFISVTYGAGGSTRGRTHRTVKRILAETALQPAAHLTCVAATREEVDTVGRDYWDAGVRHIVALRGDPPAGSGRYMPHPGGYAWASELVSGLRGIGDGVDLGRLEAHLAGEREAVLDRERLRQHGDEHGLFRRTGRVHRAVAGEAGERHCSGGGLKERASGRLGHDVGPRVDPGSGTPPEVGVA